MIVYILKALYELGWALKWDKLSQFCAERLNARGWWWSDKGWEKKGKP